MGTSRRDKDCNGITDYKHYSNIVCSKYNFNPNVVNNWKQKLIEGGKIILSDSSKDSINKNLETENERLKNLMGEQTIALDAFKKH